MNKSHDQIQQELKKLQNAAGKPLVDFERVEEYSVPLRADNKVAPAMFVPDPLIPNGFKANPVTLRAMKKDIFYVSSEGFEDLEQLIQCKGCNKEIDAQFWHFCPYCEASFSS